MKTETLTTTNQLKHTINTIDAEGNNLTINISLDDDCHNGHNDFSITGDIYQKGKPKIDKYCIAFGCVHDAILEARPDLKLFVDLHLCDSKGVPMYAIENGYYFLKTEPFNVVKNYLRLNDNELSEIVKAEDKLHFTYILHSLQLPKKWKQDADKAIKLLEEWTGETFEDDSKKMQWIEPKAEDLQMVETRLTNGYYSADKMQERKEQKQIDYKNKVINDLAKNRDKDIKKANDEFNVKFAVIDAGLSLDNFIYYNHSNEGCFNWKDYEKQISAEEFENFIKSVKIDGLPEGIKFKIK